MVIINTTTNKGISKSKDMHGEKDAILPWTVMTGKQPLEEGSIWSPSASYSGHIFGELVDEEGIHSTFRLKMTSGMS